MTTNDPSSLTFEPSIGDVSPPPSPPAPLPVPQVLSTQATYSPDGRWFWNGQQWIPVPMPTSGKSKVAAGILAILLGDFGVHKFYVGNVGLGILYLVFFWTFIPGLIGIIEGILYLTMSDQDFAYKYGGAR